MYKQSACRWLFKSSWGRLPLFSARFAVTFPPEERQQPSTSTKLYCLVTEAHRCEQLAQGCHAALSGWELNSRPIDGKSQCNTTDNWCCLGHPQSRWVCELSAHQAQRLRTLPFHIRHPDLTIGAFRRQLKTVLFVWVSSLSRITVLV